MSEGNVDEPARRDFLRMGVTITAGLVVPAALPGCNGGGDAYVPPAETFVEPLTIRSVNGVLDVTLVLSYLTTTLAPDEVLTAVRVPGAPARTGHAFEEVSRRHGDFALVGVGARVTLDAAGTVVAARVAFIGVGATAVLDEQPGLDLAGRAPTAADLDEVARAAASRLDPHGDLHATASYRRRLAATLARRALVTASARAAGEVAA